MERILTIRLLKLDGVLHAEAGRKYRRREAMVAEHVRAGGYFETVEPVDANHEKVFLEHLANARHANSRQVERIDRLQLHAWLKVALDRLNDSIVWLEQKQSETFYLLKSA